MNRHNVPPVRLPRWAWVKVALHPAGDRLLVQTDRLMTELKLDEFGFGQLLNIVEKRQKMTRRPLPSEPGTPCQDEINTQRSRRDAAVTKWLRDNPDFNKPEPRGLTKAERRGLSDDQISQIEAIIAGDKP